jgi:L-ascorbate metabolism protein UlaG (beta-lactamase superfamily)
MKILYNGGTPCKKIAMQLTYLDSNSWLIQLAGKTILLDPWLVGSLVFGNAPWLFKGEKCASHSMPEQIDLILLSQGLEDHAHPPTLKQLDHSLPVVASVNGAKVARELGYSEVTALAHNETYVLGDGVEITAVPGSPIGPFLVENGYLIKNLSTGESLYYEPHGYHSKEIKQAAPIDVVITPLISLKIPLLGPVIQGHATALEAAKALSPQVMIPTAAGGDVAFEGVLTSVLKQEGTVEEFRTQLGQHNLATQVIEPVPGEPFEVRLGQSVT